MDPLLVAERIYAGLKDLTITNTVTENSRVKVIEALTTRVNALPYPTWLAADLRWLGASIRGQLALAELVEDLSNLADWVDPEVMSGFIPFVDAETGVAPR